MSKLTESRFEAYEVQSKQIRRKGSLSIAKHQLYPIASLLFFSVWLGLSYQNDQLFFNEILLCGFLINALMFMRALDHAHNGEQARKDQKHY